ncbi:unnamed protein product [Fraxinus pennsylvanica]|uniref:Dicer-like 3 n=1 Tax=Fraxinus pennsylvanica TaxID=56036 RepID=A0AAD1YS88_9LAMI|nr:unnamed protein product [Fraxinus pennsylvanica]
MEVQDEIMLNPLKRRFEDMDSKPETGDDTSIPSEYERKVYEVAMSRNTIAVLENGAGKTAIQTMMIKEIGKTLKNNKCEKKLIIFLTPTVHLVHQQYEEIKSHTELEVEEYYGAKGVDVWNVKTWEKEVDEHDVLVMTPQILLDALRKGFLNFQVLCFIILDECHFASRKHPYAKIMKEFYHKSSNRPKIFGMTASPGIRNGLSGSGFFSNGDCQKQISELESLLDCQLYTIEDRVETKEFILMANQNSRLYVPAMPSNLELKEELESSCSKVHTIGDRMEPKEFVPLANQNCRLYDQDLPSNLKLKKKLESPCSKVYTNEDRTEPKKFIPMAKQNCRLYDPAVPSNLELQDKLESSYSKFDAVLLDFQKSLQSQHRDTDDKCEILRKRLESDHAKILFCLENLGLLCAHEAVKVCLENAPDVEKECVFYREGALRCVYFLEEVLSIFEESLPEDHEKLLDVHYGGLEAIAKGQISSKLHELLEIFRSFEKARQVSCIIFVERIITAKVIERLLKKSTDLSHLTVSWLTGSNSSVNELALKVQRETLESFQCGKVNLLFATGDVEEGTQVPKCSSVISFDLPESVHRFVWSKSRACQDDSQYILMLERGNKNQIDTMFNLVQSEYSMTDKAITRDTDGSFTKASATKEVPAYLVEVTGASVAANSSISLVHRYCDKLPRENNVVLKPTFECFQEGSFYRCKLVLPPGAPFQTITGPESRSRHLSKQLVCLDACKKLHMMGALNDHLLPVNEEPPQNDSTLKGNMLTSGAGTTKRKELHGTTCVRTLSGNWGDRDDGACFQAYKMEFSCSIAEVHYSSFLLLLESKLDDDVGNNEVELFLLKKFVRCFVSFHGEIYLDSQQMAKAKCFQELFFNGLFGKLYVKLSGKRRFLLDTEESLWDPLNMYLLLPLDSVDKPTGELLDISWTGIESCVSVVEFLKKNAWLKILEPKDDSENSLIHSNDSVTTKFNGHVIELANKSVSVDSLKEMVVVAIHTGRIYSIVHAVDNTSAESPFEAEDTNFQSYADYFHKKYGIVLKHPEQPLLLLKQSHNSHNLLVDFSKEGGNKSKNKWTTGIEQQHAHMPPELLVGTDIRTDILKPFYLLPSIMHRLESLMLASQLRDEIAGPAGGLHIKSSLILEALTTLRCNESFSMERLELLGDSVLKYTVSCHLFLKYAKLHEGQLSSRRSRAVCNATLHKLGTNRTLQEYIRDCAFDPRQWTAPGQRSIWRTPCDHEVDTREVPMDDKFVTEDEKLVVGKSCDKGHRWMGSKTVSDCVEALIGAYYVGGGLTAAIQLMKWLSIGAEVEPSWVDDVIKTASLRSYTPKAKDIKLLESKIGYEFSVKGLLLEAITHEHEQGVDYCYQRLEFLGDSVLDILVTWHLYQSHPDVDPGELTDLRAASVSNDNFAIAAVKHNLYLHLQYGFSNLGSQISEYVKSASDLSKTSILTQAIKAPKVLGDLVESIAGAMLIDTNLDMNKVWKVFKPLLSPIVTPDNLELPPCRELIELCDSLGYFIKVNYTLKGNTMNAELKLQLKDVMLLGHGSGHDRKAAKGMAAVDLLKQLEARRIVSSKRKKQGTNDVDDSSRGLDCSIISQTHNRTSEPPQKKLKLVTPVMPPINMNKGGPRSSLFDLCKRLQWPLPTFQTYEEKSKTPFTFGDKQGFNKFESRIKLVIPDFGVIELTGEARADKKASLDSAALLMLYELERQEKVIISVE